MYNQILANDISYVDLSEEMGSTVSLHVLSDDDNIYHIKLPHSRRNNNLYEYLAHIIAKEIEAPTPYGCFIVFSRELYEQLRDSIEKQITDIETQKGFRPNSLDKYLDYLNSELADMNKTDFILFGLSFIEGAVDNLSIEEFEILIDDMSNLDEFYSLYAFDFYLDNSDRHIKNILIVPHLDNLTIGYLIDHDKIFAGKNVDTSQSNHIDKTLFRCIKNERNRYLYDIIDTENKYQQIKKYAIEIVNNDNHKIDKEIDKNLYNIDSKSLELIKDYFSYRQINLIDECNSIKERCYENII